jgi:diguanylate cyclase (GGDEF)-like protein
MTAVTPVALGAVASYADVPVLRDLAEPVLVVQGSAPVSSIDRMFRLDRGLEAVVVDHARTLALLSREQLQRELDGRLGYGRALHCRSVVADLLPEEQFALAGSMEIVEAARHILTRPLGTRYQHVLVETVDGPRVVPVSVVFERVAAIYQHVALHDPLTGLPNRRLLDQHGLSVVESSSDLAQVAILYVDLDGFKAVNDTFGHRVGDDILIGFAERLRTCVRPGDVVARLGGDEFAALLVNTTQDQALAVADRIVLTATAPFVHEDQLVQLSATVGLAMASDVMHETELTHLDVLLRHADGAMLKAKGAGKRRVGRLGEGHEPTQFARHGQIRRRLREALEGGAFSLHYQPKLDLATDDCRSVEALIRWDDAELGPVSPAEFIPIAESDDAIQGLGRWVIDAACEQAGDWHRAGTARTIAVNVSARQFTTGTLVHDVMSAVTRHALPPRLLRIEITEGSAILDLPGAITQLDQLREAGIEIDLDDFGTGYSSLTMLHRLPLSAVKIDKAFIDDIDSSPADALMVRGVIDAVHALGFTVVAEGVERQTQLDLLRELGCDTVQGYLISRPVPAVDLDDRDAHRPASAPTRAHHATA